jgi:hypothetical protein
MNIEQLRSDKSKLELSIQQSINKHLQEFRQATGMTPSAIHVDMAEVTTFGMFERAYLVNRVVSNIDL